MISFWWLRQGNAGATETASQRCNVVIESDFGQSTTNSPAAIERRA